MIAEEGRAYRRYSECSCTSCAPREAHASCNADRNAVWLRDYHFFEILTHDDKLAQERFGFKAPDVLVMVLSQ